MKKILLCILLISISSFSQSHKSYKCKNISQRDSIASDLTSRGCVKKEYDAQGLYIYLQTDHTFWFTEAPNSFSIVNTLKELYSNAIEKQLYQEKKTIEKETSLADNIIDNKKEDLCSNVDVKTDKFNGEVSYNTPNIDNISFIKYKRKGIISQYVSISVYDTYLTSYNITGLSILFKSGKKIIRNKEKVDVNNSSDSYWSYSVFFTPSPNEINLLKKDEIEAVKLYIFDAEITQGDKIKEYANCVLVTPKTKLKKK
jgi:hypothetical protein